MGEMEAFASLLTRWETEVASDGDQDSSLRQELQRFADLSPLSIGAEVVKRLRRLVLVLVERLESRQDETASAAAVLGTVTSLMAFLPPSLLQSLSTASPRNETGGGLVVEIDEEAFLEPVGGKLFLTALLFPALPSSHHLIQSLPGGEGPAERALYYVEDVRSVLLPRWKSFHLSQLQQAEFTSSPPTSSQRLQEGRRLKGLFTLLLEEGVPNRVLDRLVPCVLFCVDDFDPCVAVMGMETMGLIVGGVTEEGIGNWSGVMQKTILDRLMAAERHVWKALMPVVSHFCRRVPRQEILFLEKLLERLVTDLEPYELARVFLDHAKELVERVGRPVVQLFSKIFPLLTQWLLSADQELQMKGLAFLLAVMEAAVERIPRHADILRELLSVIEQRTEGKQGPELMSRLSEVRECLEKIVSMKKHEHELASNES